MQFFKKNFLFLFLFFSLGIHAQDTIRAMVYNILDFPTAYPPNRADILREILDEYDPDIFMVCELQSEYGANLILDTSLNYNGVRYKMAPFVPSASGDFDHQQLVFYRRGMFTLTDHEAMATPVRDINYYQLQLSTADQATDPVNFEIFVTHLKSSQGTANKQLRLQSVQVFTNKLATMDPNSYVLFAGDLNFYTHTEPAYIELLDPTHNIVMADPIDRPGVWHNKPEFQDIHSQSTRINSGPFGAGAGGGLDDRFDFILMSENMKTDAKLKYIPDTYKAFGNNGNCFDNNINSPDCHGPFSQALRDNLYNFSDHLPIVMSLETNKQVVLGTRTYNVPLAITLEATLVNHELSIRLGINVPDIMTFEIYNTLGQKLMEVNTQNQQLVKIDVNHLPEGIYYLRTKLPNSPTFKFVKTF